MKKRVFALLLIAAMSFSLLAACGSKTEQPETPDTNKPEVSTPVENQDPAFSADLAEFYNKIMNAAEEGPFMMDVAAEAEMLEMLYPGLKDIQTKQLVAFTPAMSAVAIEFAFVEVANADDVVMVQAIFTDRINNQVAGGAWYPETVEGWQNHSEIVVIDNYVCLFVCAEKDGMIDAFRNGTEVPAWAKAQGETEFETEVDASVDLLGLYYDIYNELYPLDADGMVTGPYATDLMDQEESGMTAEDAAMMLEMYYPGLTAIETEQLHVFIPGMSFSAYEVVLAELTNEADVETFRSILQGRIDAQASGGAWYPEAVEGWLNNARIVTNGNYIMMAVGADCDVFVDTFNAQF